MQPIHSGPTTERIVRTAIPTLLMGGVAIAFLLDGYGGYARENAAKLAIALGFPTEPPPAIDPQLTAERGGEIAKEIRAVTNVPNVTKRLGEPSIIHGEDVYYLGPGGRLHLSIKHARVTDVTWEDSEEHSETDILSQRWLGWGLLPVGIIFLGLLIRVATTRVRLSDSGLAIRGRSLIPLDAITSIRADNYKKTGCVEVAYTINGHASTRRLNDYHIRAFRAIVDSLCEAKGFTNPLATEADAAAKQDEPAT